MSLVMGLARLAHAVLSTNTSACYYDSSTSDYLPCKWDDEAVLLAKVDLPLVQKAINSNSLELANKAWEPVRAFISEYVTKCSDGLDQTNLDQFDYFCKKVQEHGLEYWFPKDPLDSWCNDPVTGGWESWLKRRVGGEMRGNAAAPPSQKAA